VNNYEFNHMHTDEEG